MRALNQISEVYLQHSRERVLWLIDIGITILLLDIFQCVRIGVQSFEFDDVLQDNPYLHSDFMLTMKSSHLGEVEGASCFFLAAYSKMPEETEKLRELLN